MIGFFEIGIILFLSLIILGPHRMLIAARYSGLMWRKLRVLYNRIMDELDLQLRLDEMNQHKPPKKTKDQEK